MSRAAKSNVAKGDDKGSVDSTLFQLPTVPPWRTPKVHSGQDPYNRYNSVTPLRRPSTLLINHLEQSKLPSQDVDVEQLGEDENAKPLTADEEFEYDYRPFSEKSLLRESKIEGFLQAERAAHCLIFHKCAHRNDSSEKYRPDLEYDCEDIDEQETQARENKNNDNGSLLLSVPGCSKHDLKQLLNKNHMRQRPNVRRIDEILNHEFNALKNFWGDSELANGLERNHLHEQYLLLQQEQREIAQYKTVLRTQKARSLNCFTPGR